MSLIRSLYALTTKIKLFYKAIFLDTFQNAIADSASRCQWGHFRSLLPGANIVMTEPVHFELDY